MEVEELEAMVVLLHSNPRLNQPLVVKAHLIHGVAKVEVKPMAMVVDCLVVRVVVAAGEVMEEVHGVLKHLCYLKAVAMMA